MDLNRGLPGETPLPDISGLKLPWVKTIPDRFAAEYENTSEAIAKYLSRRPFLRMAPFTRKWMFKLHKEMLGRVWSWAGEARKTETNIGVKPYLIEVKMEDLARDIDAWRKSDWQDVVAQAATMHHRAVQIHPVLDGNGRWARMLANIWLRQHDEPFTAWPETDMVRQVSSIRAEYIAALKEADVGDMDPLICLQRRFTEEH